MLDLKNGMLLYHGSYIEVSSIDLTKCRPGKDFGRGFYMTSSYEQAQNFVRLSIKKQMNEGVLSGNVLTGYISVFRYFDSSDISVHVFEKADKEWLHFVASNRRQRLFPDIQKDYSFFDVIAGKIANDRTARTLQLYVSGGYGEPGTPEADDIAIRTLLPNRLEDQICFRSELAVQALKYVRSEPYDIRQK